MAAATETASPKRRQRAGLMRQDVMRCPSGARRASSPQSHPVGMARHFHSPQSYSDLSSPPAHVKTAVISQSPLPSKLSHLVSGRSHLAHLLSQIDLLRRALQERLQMCCAGSDYSWASTRRMCRCMQLAMTDARPVRPDPGWTRLPISRSIRLMHEGKCRQATGAPAQSPATAPRCPC